VRLSDYYLKKLQKRNVDVRLKTAVTGVYDQQFYNDNNDNNDNDNDNNSVKDENDISVKDDKNKGNKKEGGGRMYTIAKFNDGTFQLYTKPYTVYCTVYHPIDRSIVISLNSTQLTKRNFIFLPPRSVPCLAVPCRVMSSVMSCHPSFILYLLLSYNRY
jgi:hypothetical protein